MDRERVRAEAVALLAAAGAVRAAFPDRAAMAVVPVPALGPPAPAGGAAVGAALRCLRDEVLLVRAGGTTCPAVLDDERANAERVLAGL